MRVLAIAIIALSLVGCGDDRPAPVSAPLTVQVQAPKDKVFDAAAKELTAEGFTLAASDRSLGILSTSPRTMKLTNDDAVCPGSFGVNLTNEPRTVTKLAWSVTIADGSFTLKPSIEYSYLPGDPANGRQGEGSSTGKLERELAARIQKGITP